MNGRFRNPFVSEQEEPEIGSENGGELTFSGVITDRKTKTTSSPKKSRRDAQKRVVSVAINNMDGSPRIKSEGAPPSDSWAWRKYGQKPIKGSPYPRGYYRCSSLKGCPARKQVERSRLDPTKLLITYACEHNHPSPPSRNPNSTSTSTSATIPEFQQDELGIFTNQLDIESDDKFADLGDESLIIADDYYGWFSEVVSTSPTILENPICAGTSSGDADVAMIFRMDEEEESMYADLGELPECSMVFRRGFVEAEEEEERRRCSLRESSLCGSTG